MEIQKKTHMYVLCTWFFLKDEHASSSFATFFFSNILKLAKEEYNCVGIGFYFFLFLIRLKIISVLLGCAINDKY